LSHALSGDPELLSDLGQGESRVSIQAEAIDEDGALAITQAAQAPPDELPALAQDERLLGIVRAGIGDRIRHGGVALPAARRRAGRAASAAASQGPGRGRRDARGPYGSICAPTG